MTPPIEIIVRKTDTLDSLRATLSRMYGLTGDAGLCALLARPRVYQLSDRDALDRIEWLNVTTHLPTQTTSTETNVNGTDGHTTNERDASTTAPNTTTDSSTTNNDTSTTPPLPKPVINKDAIGWTVGGSPWRLVDGDVVVIRDVFNEGYQGRKKESLVPAKVAPRPMEVGVKIYTEEEVAQREAERKLAEEKAKEALAKGAAIGLPLDDSVRTASARQKEAELDLLRQEMAERTALGISRYAGK